MDMRKGEGVQALTPREGEDSEGCRELGSMTSEG